jgi:hypothetical protein
MGVLLMILGLASAGLVADFVIENHLASAPAESFTLFGSTISLSVPALVLSAFVAGALTIVLLKAGMVLARQRGEKRRALRRRVADLEAENAKLRTTESAEPAEPTGDTLPDPWAASSSADR